MASKIDSQVVDLKLTDKLTEAQIRFETIQKEREIEFQTNKLQYRNRIIIILMITVLLILGALIVIYRNWKKRQALSQQLLEKNNLLELQNDVIVQKSEELSIANKKLAHINENLDHLIKEKTSQLVLKNKKLIDYSFLNAHALRGPLARILGLVNLIRMQKQDSETTRLIEMLEVSSKELDTVVHKINKIVENDDVDLVN